MADKNNINARQDYIDHISKFVMENHNPGFLSGIQKNSDWNTVCKYDETAAKEILLQTKLFLRLDNSNICNTKNMKKLVWHIVGYLSQYFKNAPEFAGNSSKAKKYLRETILSFIGHMSTRQKIMDTAKKIGNSVVYKSVSHKYKGGKLVILQHVSCDGECADFVYKNDAEYEKNNEKDLLKFLRDIRAERVAKEKEKRKTTATKTQSRKAQVKSMIEKKRALLATSKIK